MTDEQAKESQYTTSKAWSEVGQQFRALGESLASAFRTTWHSEETSQHLKEMQAGLEAMVDELSQVTKKVTESEEAQKVHAEAKKMAESAKSAGQQTVEEVRPQLLSAFRKLRTELDQMISRMEQEPVTSEAASDEAASPAEETE